MIRWLIVRARRGTSILTGPTDPGRADGADEATHLISALLALAAVTVWIIWTTNDGGFAPEQWLPGTLVTIGLLTVLLLSRAARRGFGRARLPALLLGLYVLWSYLSILWSQVRGDALDGANRTLLYWVVFAFFASAPLTDRTRTILIGGWATAIVALGAVDLVRASRADGPQGFFILGRFAAPITYPNANAALFLMAFLPLQVIGSRRELPLAVRAISTGGACVALELALLGQSRGSLVAFPVGMAVYLIVTRNLLRTLPTLLIVAAAVGPVVPDLLHVYTSVVDGSGYGVALSRARQEVALTAIAATFAAFVVALADRRFTVPEKACRQLRLSLLGLGATVTVAAAIVIAVFGHPVARAHHAWDSFKGNAAAPAETIHIASGVGTSRYDVWRIALDQFAAHPLGGVGADNYLVGYLRSRRTVETARYPESIELRALSETGLVGAVLVFGFLAVALRRSVRTARAQATPTAALTALVGTSYWLAHASVDWLWEFPALAAPAFGLIGLAVGAAVHAGATDSPVAAPPRRGAALTAASRVVAVLAAVAAAATLTASWISVRQIDLAVAIAPSEPARAYDLLRQAARWNPLSEQPALTDAAIAAHQVDRRREETALRSALRRNPANWYTYLMLGIVAGQEHRLSAARGELARARRLSPLEPVVIYAERNLAVGNPLSEQEIGDVFRVRSRTLRGVAQR